MKFYLTLQNIFTILIGLCGLFLFIGGLWIYNIMSMIIGIAGMMFYLLIKHFDKSN